jgi:hypothetical protein
MESGHPTGSSTLGQDQLCVLDASTRLSAAQSEIGSRLLIRAQIQIYHIVVISALAGVYVSALSQDFSNTLQAALATAIPFISMYFIALYTRNEERIGYLAAYAAAIEAASESSVQNRLLPRWFTPDEGWILNSKRTAEIGVDATILLSLASPALLVFDAAYSLLTSGLWGMISSEKTIFLLPLLLIWFPIRWSVRKMAWAQWFRYDYCSQITYDYKNRKMNLPDVVFKFHFSEWFRKLRSDIFQHIRLSPRA